MAGEGVDTWSFQKKIAIGGLKRFPSYDYVYWYDFSILCIIYLRVSILLSPPMNFLPITPNSNTNVSFKTNSRFSLNNLAKFGKSWELMLMTKTTEKPERSSCLCDLITKREWAFVQNRFISLYIGRFILRYFLPPSSSSTRRWNINFVFARLRTVKRCPRILNFEELLLYTTMLIKLS